MDTLCPASNPCAALQLNVIILFVPEVLTLVVAILVEGSLIYKY
jgi:hypothetical protein